MAKKSGYPKAVDYGQRYLEAIYHYSRFWRAYNELMDWIKGIPQAKTPRARARQESNIVVPLLEWLGTMLGSDVEEIGQTYYKRYYRPVYVKVAQTLPIALYYKWDIYRLAEACDTSPRVVRNAFWFMRLIGVELPYVPL